MASRSSPGCTMTKRPWPPCVAKHYGLRHHVRIVSRAEFEQDIPRILDAMDQPSIDGVNTGSQARRRPSAATRWCYRAWEGTSFFAAIRCFDRFREWPLSAGRLPPFPVAARCWMRLVQHSPSAGRSPSSPACRRFMDSLEGAYFLRRSLFLPAELPALMGEDMARDGPGYAGRQPAGRTSAGARNAAAGVACWNPRFTCGISCCATATGPAWRTRWNCGRRWWMRNCWQRSGPMVASFRRGMGKAMLAHAPESPCRKWS